MELEESDILVQSTSMLLYFLRHISNMEKNITVVNTNCIYIYIYIYINPFI